jgi:hypothetical protein
MIPELLDRAPTVAVALMLLVLVVAHFVVPPTYNYRVHSISDLGAQGYDKSWIMRLGFIGFGGILAAGAMVRVTAAGELWLMHALIGIYAILVLLTGLLSTKPFEGGIAYRKWMADWHSYFAIGAGIAFSGGLVVAGILDPVYDRKVMHFGTLLFVVALSMLFGLMPSVKGYMQRLMYLGAFSWLVLVYESMI